MKIKNIVFISTDEQLCVKFPFALKLIGVPCLCLQNMEDVVHLNLEDTAALFFDAETGFQSAVELAFAVKKNRRGKSRIPFFLCRYNQNNQALIGEYTVFDDICILPFLRQTLYSLLRKHNVINQHKIRITPFLHAFPEECILEFLEKVRTDKEDIVPLYDCEYHYPQADLLLPGDRHDSIALLLKLCSRGILERKIFDRVHQCPQCSAMRINFRECCPQCHSIDFVPTEMLHHYPCGYVGDLMEFQRHDTDNLLCPKCSKVLRHIGMDYEKPVSSFLCNSCRLRFTIAAVRCRCFQCGADFEPGKAMLQTFYSYQCPPENTVLRNTAESDGFGNFSVSRETFICLLQQTFGISREMGFPIQIIAADISLLRDSERMEFIRILHEFKRETDVMYASLDGIVLTLVFYHTSEEVRESVEKFNAVYRSSPGLPRDKVKFRVHQFTGAEKISAGRLIDHLTGDFAWDGKATI